MKEIGMVKRKKKNEKRKEKRKYKVSGFFKWVGILGSFVSGRGIEI